MPSYCFFPQKTLEVILMSSHVWKQLDCIMIFYFYLVCFTFSISCSVSPFHSVYISQFLCLFFLLLFFLRPLSNAVEKLVCACVCVCVCVCICIVCIILIKYILKNMNFCLSKYLWHLVSLAELSMNRMVDF